MTPDPYDVLIVGSGAGGAAAAYRLVRAGLRVLVLEKGADLPRDGSTLDVERVVRRGEFLSREAWLDGDGRSFAPEEHFNIGGKTKWYGAALFRFSPREFESEPAHQCLGWPIGHRDLEPYYAEVEKVLGVRAIEVEPDLKRIISRLTGPRRNWTAMAMPMGLSPTIAAHEHEAAHFDGFASNLDLKGEAQHSLLVPLAGHPGFTLLANCEVVSLIGASGRAERVVGVRLADGREFTAARVILAAGALHSPRLLQRYLHATGLAKHLVAAASVGRNLKLHLLTAMVSVSVSRKRDLIRKTTVFLNERFPHSSVQPLGFDAEVIASLIPALVPKWLARAVGARSYGFFLQTEDGSSPDNRVVDAEANDTTLPLLDHRDSRVAQASREHRALTRAFQLALARAGFASFTKRIGLAGTAHACGTLVCGDDPARSVVDAKGRVHGMRGLYVVDGSILPRSSRVNPSLTIYAWALRTADLLLREFDFEQSLDRGTAEPIRVG